MVDLTPYSASLIADCLDESGHTAQTLAPELRMFVPVEGRFYGRARTLSFRALPPDQRFAVVDHERAVAQLRWREEWDLATGDVVVIGVDGEVPACCLQGDLVSLYLARRGVRGVVADGYVRDLAELRAIGFGVVARGASPTNGRGRLARGPLGAPVAVGGVTIHEGDLVFADQDGCVVIPRDVASSAAFAKLLADARAGEAGSADMIRAGHTLAEAFDRHRRL